MDQSMQSMKRVSSKLLEERLEVVKELRAGEHEEYQVAKDRLTGEHYLLYAYDHIQIADGHKETYYHLLPINHDDVLAIVLGEQAYAYPESWTRPYLRNGGEHDEYVWFDPSRFGETEAFEQIGHELQQKLTAFKREGTLDPDAVRRLLEDLDKLN